MTAHGTGRLHRLRAGLVQMRSGSNVEDNLATARHLIGEAADAGADMIVTPEMTNIIETDREALLGCVATVEDDITLAGLRCEARRLGVWLVIGSLALKGPAGKLVNRSFLIDDKGVVVAWYDKIHMFDVDVGETERYRESRTYQAGDRAVTAATPWGPVGLSICYDVRFPALYERLARAGAGIITVPAAFTRPTGKAHWQVLLQARAIEAGAFIMAAAQGGEHACGRKTWGHSMIVGPWGEIIAELGEEPGVVVADVDLDQVIAARARIARLGHGRNFIMGGVAKAAEVV